MTQQNPPSGIREALGTALDKAYYNQGERLKLIDDLEALIEREKKAAYEAGIRESAKYDWDRMNDEEVEQWIQYLISPAPPC